MRMLSFLIQKLNAWSLLSAVGNRRPRSYHFMSRAASRKYHLVVEKDEWMGDGINIVFILVLVVVVIIIILIVSARHRHSNT